jgi:hypothetical protein
MDAKQPERKRVFLGSAGIVMLLVAIGALLVALNIVTGVNTVIPGRQSANIPIKYAYYAAAPLFGVAGLAILLRHFTGFAGAPWVVSIIGCIVWVLWIASMIGCCP